jgi:hypothetical protein
MKGLTGALLGRACRTFLALAYPDGPQTVPPAKQPYLHINPDDPLGPLLAPPVCLALPAPGGGVRGYSFRLSCTHYPHLKLQVVAAEDGSLVFTVDTHDDVQLAANHPDLPRWRQLQAANRELKVRIERAWEADGLLTFNGLLRRELGRK